MMDSILEKAIEAVTESDMAFCKFISANDAGKTGSHQSGFYIPHEAWPILFDSPGQRGSNKDCRVRIRWQKDFETTSRFIYYGQGTRNEYRITRFGRGFPFLADDHHGDLLVLARVSGEYYEAFVLCGDDVIEYFLASCGINPKRGPFPP
jgi:hypothetical protein